MENNNNKIILKDSNPSASAAVSPFKVGPLQNPLQSMGMTKGLSQEKVGSPPPGLLKFNPLKGLALEERPPTVSPPETTGATPMASVSLVGSPLTGQPGESATLAALVPKVGGPKNGRPQRRPRKWLLLYFS